MAKQSTIIKNWPKYLLQWGVLIAIIVFVTGLVKSDQPVDPEAHCPMGGIQAFATWLANGSLPCSMSSMQIFMGLALLVGVILFSKLFCGLVCPLGTVEDLLIKLRNALHIKSIKIRSLSVADRILRVFKYLLAFWIFYMTIGASELFCKNLDPYYAVATGFKGEITLWMSICTLTLLILGGLLIDRFWCRYICPLGAISNSFKFWLWTGVLFLSYYLLNLALAGLGVQIPWWALLAAFCLLGYLLEILHSKPKLQLLYMMKDNNSCTHCGVCSKKCPYNIDINSFENGRINSVDCTLCGECAAACNTNALAIGAVKSRGHKWMNFLPLVITVVLFAVGVHFGRNSEIPTINETWGDAPEQLETTLVEGLRSVKCYGSSMAFKAKLEKIPGIYGVKTYVNHHRAAISYDPAVTNPDKIREAIYVPSTFRVASPDKNSASSVKYVTIRTENMYDKMDLNYLGMQMRLSGKKVYGLESEFACPLIVRVYMAEDETLTDEEHNTPEAWFKDVVEMKQLEMPQHGGGTKTIDVDYKFIRLEEGEGHIGMEDYIRKMFTPFRAKFAKRVAEYEGKKQYIYEIADQNYEKPIYLRNAPFLSNHLSREEGIIGVAIELNSDLVPAIRIRYAEPMTSDRIWELINMETWNIKYAEDDIRQVPAKIQFSTPGVVLEAINEE